MAKTQTVSAVNQDDRDVVITPEGKFAFEGSTPEGIVVSATVTDEERKRFNLPDYYEMRRLAAEYEVSEECEAYKARVIAAKLANPAGV